MIAQIPMKDDRKTGYQFLSQVKDKYGKFQAYHPGIDLNAGNSASADLGLPVKPMAAGKVIFAKNAGEGWGNLVVVWHEELKVWSRYAHFKQVYVKAGDIVGLNTVIGLCGKSGTASPHCHFEVIIRQLKMWTLYPNGWNKAEVEQYWTSPYKFIEMTNAKAPTVSDFAEESVAKAVKKLKTLNWDNPQKIIGDATAEQIFVNMGALNKSLGNLTKERFIVALDRLGLLG